MSTRLQGLPPAATRQLATAAQALDAGRPDVAGQYLQTLVQAHPDHPEVLRLRAGILGMQGQPGEAVKLMQHALTQRPDDALYHNTAATLLGNAGHYDAAIESLQNACRLEPDLADAWYNLGIMLTRCVRYDEAVDALQRAVELAPDNPAARAQLADLLRTSGRVMQARDAYRQILAATPWAGMAWWGLADLKTVPFEADDIPRMQAALEAPRASDDDRIATGFALARAMDEAGQYADSLRALAQAHALARRRGVWDADGFARHVSALLDAFDPAPTPANDDALGNEVIFIAGLPRSGSTLVEQILASHPSVQGAGELPDLALVLAEESRRRGTPFPHWVAAMQPHDWARLGRRYLERTAHWQKHTRVFTDKMPGNWMYIGAIRAMLPGAGIVCCRRDPLETCFSCYRQHLFNNEFTRTFEDLAAFWHDFDRASRHAQAQYPGRVHVHDHEQLLARPRARIEALLEACGLDFDPACLTFHQTQRDVRSPSATQVRQPLQRSTAHTPRYGELLDPLRRALAQYA